MDKKQIKEVMSHMGYLSHRKSPRSKEHYREMGLKSGEARRKKKVDKSKEPQ